MNTTLDLDRDLGPQSEKTQARRARSRLRDLVHKPVLIFVIFLAAIVLGPLLALTAKAVAGGGLVTLLQYRDIGEILINTVTLAVGALVVALVFGITLAVSVSRCPPKWQKFLALIPLLPLVIPNVANTMGWIFLLSPRAGYLNGILRELPWWSDATSGPVDLFSMFWMVLLTGFGYTGFVYLYVSSSLSTIGGELAAAAQVSGASSLRVFFTVTLPLMRPAIVYSSGLILLMGLGQFTNPLLLGSPKNIDVLTTVLFRTTASYPIDYSLGAAVSIPLIVAGVLVMYLQRKSIGEETKYAVVTGKSNYRQAGASRLFAIPIALFGIFAVALPLIALVMVSVSPYWSSQFSFSDATLKHIVGVFDDAKTLNSFATTMIAIVVALIAVIPIGLIGALVLHGSIRSSRFIRKTVDLITTLPMAMPAAIMGFAMLYAYTNPPFSLYGTVTIIALTYITLMIPHAMRPQVTSLMSMGREFTEASLVSGASRLRTFLAIELVLTRKGITVAASIVMILLFHEFTASLMVSTSSVQTIGALLYSYYTGGIYPQVAVLSLLMVVVTAIGVSIVSIFGGGKALVS
jgi:iron(III) transport system permease protein